jgi:hypothetical protein
MSPQALYHCLPTPADSSWRSLSTDCLIRQRHRTIKLLGQWNDVEVEKANFALIPKLGRALLSATAEVGIVRYL